MKNETLAECRRFLKARYSAILPLFLFYCLTTAANAQVPGVGDDLSSSMESWSEEVADQPQTPPPATFYDEAIEEGTYYLGPGDILDVFVGKNYSVKVNPESYLAFPGVEPILVRGLTLKEAKVKIRGVLGKKFNASLIQISIANIKILKVSVLGEVQKPGALIVPGNTRVSELIRRAGGFSKAARIPIVQVLHADGSQSLVNLSAYYGTGDVSSNPYPRLGDRVVVPRVDPSEPHITIVSAGRSFLYQLPAGSVTLGQILTEISGILGAVARDAQNPNAERKVHSVDTRAARVNSGAALTGKTLLEYELKNGDVVEFASGEASVYVEGAVTKPWVYDYQPGKSVRDYMAEAALPVDAQHNGKVTVVRADGTKVKLNISSTDILPGDHIFVSRTPYATFKDLVVTVSQVATVVLTFIYLGQTF